MELIQAYGVVSDAKLNNFIASLRVDFPPNRPQGTHIHVPTAYFKLYLLI